MYRATDKGPEIYGLSVGRRDTIRVIVASD